MWAALFAAAFLHGCLSSSGALSGPVYVYPVSGTRLRYSQVWRLALLDEGVLSLSSQTTQRLTRSSNTTRFVLCLRHSAKVFRTPLEASALHELFQDQSMRTLSQELDLGNRGSGFFHSSMREFLH